MNNYLLNRDIGSVPPKAFHHAQTDRVFRSLRLSSRKTLKKRHFGAVNAVNVEQINGR